MKGQRRFLPLCILLTISVSIEFIVACLYASKIEFAWIYQIYSIFDYTLETFPGVNINTEEIASFHYLYLCAAQSKHTSVRRLLQKHQDFWISLGVLIFFGRTFLSNGVYAYLIKMDRDLAKKLFNIINSPVNLIQYSCFILGFVCAVPQKSTIQLS